MKPEEVFKRYDIRGKYPEELNEEFAKRIGKALGSFASENFSERVVVSKDNKESSASLKEALIEGLRSTGVKVIDVGTGPTDYAAFAGMEHGAVSVQVTSSHMPLDFNGFKLMYPEGNGFVNEDLNEVKRIFREEAFTEGSGDITDLESTMKQRYRDRIRIRGARLGSQKVEEKIVVDTLGGAAQDFLPDLLRDLGAEVIDLAEEKDEMPYRDPPNPKPENLDELRDRVEETDADLGIATDMDADRVTVYKDGFLSGDEVFGLMAQAVRDDLVASIDTSKAIEELQEENSKEIFYTRVGDPFVMDKALKEDVGLAGEPNGHYSVLEFVPYNSGILTALAVAGTDIEEGLEDFPDYSVERFSTSVEDKEERMKEIKEAVESKYSIVSEVDGVKFETENCDVLVRPSGSSPKIRVIAESESEEALTREMPKIVELVQKP
ncbi:MAG: hypothetical protein ABEK04_04910 [Candidatus Nanohalobium sp.]